MSTATGYDPSSASYRADESSSPEGEMDAQLVQEARNEIRNLVQEITALAQADIPLAQFYDGLLSRVVNALAAQGGAIWTVKEGQLELSYRINFESTGLDANNQSRHQGLLNRVIETGQPVAAPPRSGVPEITTAGNPTDLLMLISPIQIGDDTVGLLEVMQRPGAGPTTQRGYLRFLAQMCDLAGSFLRNRRLRQFSERDTLWRKLESFLDEIHKSLDLKSTAYAIANEGRLLVGCDRLSVTVARGNQYELVAVSGLDNLDRRTEQARLLAQLVQIALKPGEAFWHDRNSREHPPQVEGPLSHYVDRSHTKALAILPLREPANEQMIGAIVLESMTDDDWSESAHNRAKTVVRYASPGIAHAIQYNRMLFVPLARPLGEVAQKLFGKFKYRTIAAAICIVAVVAAFVLVPAPFEISAKGKLQPSERQEIFAPENGTITRVPVRHGDRVRQGDVLAELSSTEIEVELTELLGRQNVAQQQLETFQRTLLENSRGGKAKLSVADENRIAGEILQLRQTLAGIDDELKLIRQKQARLTIRAERDGEVVTWQVEQQLLRRPVTQGQSLMTVVNPDGDWELELLLPERRLVHIDRAGEGSEQPLSVTFMLSSQPGVEYEGQIIEVERTAQVLGEEGNVVLVRVALESDRLPSLRSDTTVTGKIHCGSRSLGYVWFCDLFESIQTHVLFWL